MPIEHIREVSDVAHANGAWYQRIFRSPHAEGQIDGVACGIDGRPSSCLAEVEALIQATWERSIQLHVQVSSDLPLVTCDPLALQNAVLNLLFNARDAMPDGGAISISAAAILLESGVPGVEVRIADNGIGMTPDTIIRAFDPFFTTKCDGLGGIGLPMVDRFARDVGGHILIESEYGVGTTVTLKLPALQPLTQLSYKG